MFKQVRYHCSVSEAGNSPPVTQHCGLPAAVKAGLGRSAAAPMPAPPLSPSLGPLADGPPSGAVHRANTAFTTSFPAPWSPPPCVEHHWGEVNPHSPAGIRAFPVFLLPFVLQAGGSAAT